MSKIALALQELPKIQAAANNAEAAQNLSSLGTPTIDPLSKMLLAGITKPEITAVPTPDQMASNPALGGKLIYKARPPTDYSALHNPLLDTVGPLFKTDFNHYASTNKDLPFVGDHYIEGGGKQDGYYYDPYTDKYRPNVNSVNSLLEKQGALPKQPGLLSQLSNYFGGAIAGGVGQGLGKGATSGTGSLLSGLFGGGQSTGPNYSGNTTNDFLDWFTKLSNGQASTTDMPNFTYGDSGGGIGDLSKYSLSGDNGSSDPLSYLSLLGGSGGAENANGLGAAADGISGVPGLSGSVNAVGDIGKGGGFLHTGLSGKDIGSLALTAATFL